MVLNGSIVRRIQFLTAPSQDFVKHVKSLGMPMGIATGSGLESYKIKTLKHKEIFDLFDFVVTGDDVVAGKPDPEIYIKSLNKFKDPDPKKTLIFEDSANGVISGSRAGIPCVWVIDERNTPPDIKLPSDVEDDPNILKITSLKQFDLSILHKVSG